MIILGIDPGSQVTGYGLIEQRKNEWSVLTYGVVRLRDTSTHVLRLKAIFEKIGTLIAEYLPDEVAVEMPVYGRNPQSMLKLGRAQAAASLAALARDIPVSEYTPKEIKKAVTGKGNASKEQVWYMMQHMLGIREDKGHDASDALAVAMCHAHRRTAGEKAGAPRSWKAFVRANQHRIIES